MNQIIPTRLTIVLLAAIIAYFAIILSLLKHKKLNMKYTLLWLFTGAVFFILVLKPIILIKIINMIGITGPMNGLFIMLIAFLIMLVLSLTSIASRQAGRITKLIQTQGLLEKRVRELEKAMEEQLKK